MGQVKKDITNYHQGSYLTSNYYVDATIYNYYKLKKKLDDPASVIEL